MKNMILIGLVFITMIISSCTENPVVVAEKLDIDIIAKTPGFTWYYDEVSLYQPKQDVVAQVISKFNPVTDKFLIFVKPTCSCTGTYKQFPAMMKVINNAGISKGNYDIYSMSSTYNDYPFKSQFTIHSLPALYLIRNGVAIFSVQDSLNKRNYFKPNGQDTLFVEEVILEGLSK